MPAILALGRLSLKDWEIEASLDYMMRPYQNKGGREEREEREGGREKRKAGRKKGTYITNIKN
jgi:hypothetical protein